MADTKRKLALFALYDKNGIEKTLEAESEKGWMIEKFGGFTWKYKRVEAMKRHVTVMYVPDASYYDSKPSEKEEFLEELCESDGWKLRLSYGQIKIFYNEQENPRPIETEPLTQVENIHKAMKKKGNRDAWFNLILGIYLLALFFWQFWIDPAHTLSAGYTLWLMLDGLLIVGTSLFQLISWRIWYRKAMKAASSGEFYKNHSTRGLMITSFILSCLISVFVLVNLPGKAGFVFIAAIPVFAAVLITNKVRDIMKESGASRRSNIAASVTTAVIASIVLLAVVTYAGIKFHLVSPSKPVGTYEMYGRSWDVYDNDLPLTVENLAETKQKEWSRDKDGNESFLAAQYFYRQWPLSENDNMPEISYTVTDIKMNCFYDLCKNKIINKKHDRISDGKIVDIYHYEAVNTEPWGADEVYQVRNDYGMTNQYLLCYKNRIVELDLWETPTPEHMKIIRNKLYPLNKKH